MQWVKFSVLEIALAVTTTASVAVVIGMTVEIANINDAMGVNHGVGRFMQHERKLCEAANNTPCVIKAVGVPVTPRSNEPISLLDFVDPQSATSVRI